MPNALESDLVISILQHLADAKAALDKLRELHERKSAKEQLSFRRKAWRLLRSKISPERKTRILMAKIKHFSLLCRLDDCGIALDQLRSELEDFAEASKISVSETATWREELHEHVLSLFAVDLLLLKL